MSLQLQKDRIQKLRASLDTMETVLEKFDSHGLASRIYLGFDVPEIIVYIPDIYHLRLMRSQLREILGTWKDTVSVTCVEEQKIVCEWRNDFEGITIAIWMYTDIHNIPPALKKDNCHFVEETTTKYRMVCPTEKVQNYV